MKKQYLCLAVVSFSLLLWGCGKPAANSGEPSSKSTKPKYTFALVAKAQSNPVFESARVGAEDAAIALGKQLGVDIEVEWRTPNEEDAEKQVEYIDQLVLQGVNGISVSCTEAPTLTPAIDRAVKGGVPVMCFDSDAPLSQRFCYYGTDDNACGHTIMRELAAVLGPGHHVVAIPGGNQNSLNIQNRIKGALDEATNYPNIAICGVFYSKEVPQDAAAKMEEVQTANPDIDGWAMVGSWALFTDALLKWEPGKVKIVAMDALPAELPYLRKGVVQKLYAQQTYQWGWQSVDLLAQKVIEKKNPNAIIYSPLIPVTATNVDEFEQNWKQWLRK
ncbi:MAG TPA: substrate-binding domain-containing protein [Verrucomicrobiae bacterium]|jgi:ribose transport system substrate-binding protein